MWLELDVQRQLSAAGQQFQLQAALRCTQPNVVLFGPSGAGKSLTLKAVAGLLRPDAGVIRMHGQALFDAAAGINLSPQRRRIGYVFQDYALFPHLTVAQNIAFGSGFVESVARPPRRCGGAMVAGVPHRSPR